MADLGEDGIGRLDLEQVSTAPATVRLREDGIHGFGFKLTEDVFGGNSNITVIKAGLSAAPPQLDFTFPTPPEAVEPGSTVSMRLTMPDGESVTIELKAVAQASDPPVPNEFVIGATPELTSEAFMGALEDTLKLAAEGELKAASTFVAAENFFNAAGEPVLRVDGGASGDFYNATSMKVADKANTVMWYSGTSAAVSASNLGRLTPERSGNVVTLTQNEPVSAAHGFDITNVGSTSANAAAVRNAGPPTDMTVTFGAGALTPNTDKVTVTLQEPAPSNKTREITLTAVDGRPGPGQFTIGATPDQTAENFETALIRSVTEAAADAEGNPRHSVSAAVEDSGRVYYGMQANESGYLRLMRSLAAMSVETYPELTNAADPNAVDLNPAKARFDAMARRQQLELSEARNVERGSIELVTMELGVARAAANAATARHTNYEAQLENLLSDVETVNKEDVAMEILALQTRLTASYQVTAMVSQLSLVNFL